MSYSIFQFMAVILLAYGYGYSQVPTASTLDINFQKHEIIPDVISKAPSGLLYVKYPDGGQAHYGNEIPLTSTEYKPKVLWDVSPNSLYTLIMLGLDGSTSRLPTRRHWLHWLVGNIPGRDITRGDVLAEYLKPSSPKGVGAFRYVLLVYKQNRKLAFQEQFPNKESACRGSFNIDNFTSQYHLGDPVAGNFFVVFARRN